jgi:hypothetical protein
VAVGGSGRVHEGEEHAENHSHDHAHDPGDDQIYKATSRTARSRTAPCRTGPATGSRSMPIFRMGRLISTCDRNGWRVRIDGVAHAP